MERSKKRWIVRALIGFVALVVLAVAAIFFYYWRNPLAALERASRKNIAEYGLERVETEFPTGRFVYFQGGEGPLVVLLHGAGHQAGVWAKVAADLLPDYRVVVPDLPGHGDSEPAEGPLMMSDIYSGLETLLNRELAGNRPIVVGNSMGAWLGMIYALRNPDGLSRLIAVNGGALTNDPGDLTLLPPDRPAARRLVDALRDPSSPQIPDFVLDDLVRRSRNNPIARMMQDLPGLQEHLLDGKLGEIDTPVDLIWGESDRLMDLDYAEQQRQELPLARLTPIEKCGHIPHNECPSRFWETLQSVLASGPPESADPATAGENNSEGPGGQT